MRKELTELADEFVVDFHCWQKTEDCGQPIDQEFIDRIIKIFIFKLPKEKIVIENTDDPEKEWHDKGYNQCLSEIKQALNTK